MSRQYTERDPKYTCALCNQQRELHNFRNGKWYCAMGFENPVEFMSHTEVGEEFVKAVNEARRMDDFPEKMRKDALKVQDRRNAATMPPLTPGLVEWAVRIQGPPEGYLGGLRTLFEVGPQAFTLVEEENTPEGRERCEFFQRMFLNALARIGVDIKSAAPANAGTCCSCGYHGEEETPCGKRADETHCVHWWDGPDEEEPLVVHRDGE